LNKINPTGVEHAARRAECRLSRRDRAALVAPGVGAVFNPATCVFNPSVPAAEALCRTPGQQG